MLLPSEIEPDSFLPLTEFGLTAILVAAAFILPRLGTGLFVRMERSFERLSRRGGMSIYVGVAVIALRLALLPWFPIPLPFVPDDFSFLLAGDTFAHGLLTNPTPAMWTHFESVHIDMQPTYQSMYFPGQGLLLAAGKILLGQPWFALLVMDGLLCAALVWMLQAWLPRKWALLGGMLAVLRLGLFSVWINTYHTAALPSAFGGTLVLGSLPRLMKTGRFRYGLSMSIGIAILVLTRPYEGLLMCLPVGAALGYWAFKKGRQGKNRPPLGILARRAIAPLLLIFATLSWLGYYDYRAFGNALTLPYTRLIASKPTRLRLITCLAAAASRSLPTGTLKCVLCTHFYKGIEFPLYERVHSMKGFLARDRRQRLRSCCRSSRDSPFYRRFS